MVEHFVTCIPCDVGPALKEWKLNLNSFGYVRKTMAKAWAWLQRHVARAFWHVASTEDNRVRILAHGGLGSLLRLAQADNKGIQSQSLARQALRRLADDAQLRSQLPLDAQASLDAALSQAALSPVLPLLSPGNPGPVASAIFEEDVCSESSLFVLTPV